MRIGIEAQRLMRKKKHGMDMVALQLIKALPVIAPQHEYVIFVRPGDDMEVLQTLGNVRVVMVKGLSYADWEQIWLPLAILRNKIDVMHFTSNTASILCPVPFVLTLHDVIFMENSARSSHWYQRLGAIYRSWDVPYVVRKSKKVVTVSQFELGSILKVFPGIKKNLCVIYNAVSDTFSNSNTILSNEIQDKLPPRYILFLGNTDPKKNTGNVIKSYIYYREYLHGQLPLIIGDYPRELVESLVKEEGADQFLKDIISLGYIQQSQLSVLYRRATAFLYPSLRESFGIPILEAMASGCPVITSTTSSMPEVSGDAAILIDPTDVREMAKAIHRIELNENLRRDMISKGHKRALEFSWLISAKEYAQLYQECVHPQAA